MKNKFVSFILCCIMLMCGCVTAFAADHQLVYDVAFDSDKNLVTVNLSVENAIGLEAADFSLAYNHEMFEYVDFKAADSNESDAMIVAGKAATNEGLATCSVIFVESCQESDLDENGRLSLVTFSFKPLNAEYDLDDFCYWASSYEADGADLEKSVNVVGKQELMEDLTDGVTYVLNSNNAGTTKGGTAPISGESTSKWHVYLIAGVLAVGAVAGIAIVAVKGNKNEDDSKKDNTDGNDNKAEKADGDDD